MNMRPMMIVAFLATTISLSASASQTWPTIQDITHCRGNKSVVAACYPVHGHMFLANGSPSLRIWPAGTSRLLGVMPSEQEIIPSKIREQLAFGVRIYADFSGVSFRSARVRTDAVRLCRECVKRGHRRFAPRSKKAKAKKTAGHLHCGA